MSEYSPAGADIFPILRKLSLVAHAARVYSGR